MLGRVRVQGLVAAHVRGGRGHGEVAGVSDIGQVFFACARTSRARQFNNHFVRGGDVTDPRKRCAGMNYPPKGLGLN